MADAPRFLSDLPRSLQNTLASLGENKNTNPEEFVKAIKSYGYDEQTAARLGEDANRSYKPVPPLVPEQTSQQTSSPDLSGGASILGGIAAVGLHVATADTSGADTIMADVNDKELNRQMEELFRDGGPLHDIQDPAELQKKLQEIDPNNLLDNQFNQLKGRLQESEADPNTIEDLEKEHARIKKKASEKPESKKEKELRAKREAGFKSSLDNQLKQLEERAKKNPKLDAKAERNRILRQHTQMRLRLKLQENNQHFDKLLTKSFLGFGKRSTIPTVKKKVLRNIHNEQKAKADEEKTRKIQHTLVNRRVVRRFRVRVPQGSQQRPTIINAGGQHLPTTSPQAASPNPLSGLPTSAAKSFLMRNPVILAIIVGVLLTLFFIILIMEIMQLINLNPLTPIQQVACGKSEVAAIADTGTGIYAEIGQKFFVKFNPEASSSPIDDRVTPSAIFTTICVLFGHTDENLYQDFKYNTFGTLVTERDLFFDSGTGLKPKAINYTVVSNQASYPTCEIAYVSQTAGSGEIDWSLINPELCVTPIDGGKGTATPRLQFLLAKSLAYSLVIQQQHLNKGNNVFDTNFQQSGLLTTPGLLPTTSCQKTEDTSFDISGKFAFTQNTNCFSDMVGEYLTYPFYFDGIYPSISPSPILLPTPTPTPSQISGSPTPPPFYTINSSPLSDFNDDKNTWNAYYLFVKSNLFDGEDLFSTKSDIDNNAKLITDNLMQSACTDGADGGDYNFFDQIKPNQGKPPSTFVASNGYVVKARGPDASNTCTGVRFWCTHLIVDSYAMAGIKDLANQEDTYGLTSVENMRMFFGTTDSPKQTVPHDPNLIFIPYYSFPRNSQEQSLEQNLLRVQPGDAMFQESVRATHNGEEHVMLVDKIQWVPNGSGDGTIYFYQSNSSVDTYDHFAIHNWLIDTGAQSKGAWEITGFGAPAPTPGTPPPPRSGTY